MVKEPFPFQLCPLSSGFSLTTIFSGWEVIADEQTQEIICQGHISGTSGTAQMNGPCSSGTLLKIEEELQIREVLTV